MILFIRAENLPIAIKRFSTAYFSNFLEADNVEKIFILLFNSFSILHTAIHCCIDEEPIDCEYCAESFDSIAEVLTHLDLHNENKFYQCDKCKKKNFH